MRRRFAIFAIAAMLGAGRGDATAADPEAADRQYRIARRLAAEGSSQAFQAFEKVLELDPDGGLADDARVEQARLLGVARWPEELGRIDAGAAATALLKLDRLLTSPAGADRAAEARYYRALLRLEPLASHDAVAARLDLLSVATDADATEWTRSARYALGWVAEVRGQARQARASWQRLLVDEPQSPAARRGRSAIASSLMRDGEATAAARWLEPLAAELPAAVDAATRVVLQPRGAGSFGPRRVVNAATGIRSLAGIAPFAGGMLLGDARGGLAIALDENGAVIGRWGLDALQAIAVDPLGRAWAAAGDRIWRLEPDRPARAVGAQGDFTPVSGLAVDSLGRAYLLDRRGERIGVLEPGAAQAVALRENGERRLEALCWDGRGLVAIDGRGRTLVRIDAEGREARPFAPPGLARPMALAVDAARRIAAIDAKDDVVRLFAADGSAIASFDAARSGVGRPQAVAFGADGALHLFDGTNGAWVKLP